MFALRLDMCQLRRTVDEDCAILDQNGKAELTAGQGGPASLCHVTQIPGSSPDVLGDVQTPHSVSHTRSVQLHRTWPTSTPHIIPPLATLIYR